MTKTKPKYKRGMWDIELSKEDPERCIRKVTDHTGFHFFQCSRKRCAGPEGLFCKQHAKKVSA